ncbi:MAG TPA: peptidase M28, partial [Gemmatales bacterium]|nr:peptidase M28 [Gemmatales bacterium]
TGSENLKRANEWAAEKFREYGLENVKLEPYTIPAAWERGFARMKLVEPNNGRTLTVASRAWTPGTSGKITGEVVFLNATNQEELNQYKGKLKNAIVLQSKPADVRPIADIGKPREPRTPGKAAGNTPPRDPNNVARRRAPGGGFLEFRRAVDQFLRAEGVACTVTDSAKPHGLLNMTGSWGSGDRTNAADPLPNVFMTHDDYAMLYRLITRPDASPVKVEV